MKKKLIFVALVVMGSTLSHAMSTEQVKESQSTFKTFQKDIKCMFSRTRCSDEQKARLWRQGKKLLTFVGIALGVAVGAGIYKKRYTLRRWWSPPRRVAPGKQEDDESRPTRSRVSEVISTPVSIDDDDVAILISLAEQVRPRLPKESASAFFGGGMEESTLEAEDEAALQLKVDWAKDEYGRIQRELNKSEQQIKVWFAENATKAEENRYQTFLDAAGQAYQLASGSERWKALIISALRNQLKAINVLEEAYKARKKQLEDAASKKRARAERGLFIQ